MNWWSRETTRNTKDVCQDHHSGSLKFSKCMHDFFFLDITWHHFFSWQTNLLERNGNLTDITIHGFIWNKHGFEFSSRAKSFTIYIDLKLRSADAHFRFIGSPSRCINVRYAIPFIVIPFMFWVHVMLEFRIAKEKENQDTVKRAQQNVYFFFQ